jgi:hypothetical protein
MTDLKTVARWYTLEEVSVNDRVSRPPLALEECGLGTGYNVRALQNRAAWRGALLEQRRNDRGESISYIGHSPYLGHVEHGRTFIGDGDHPHKGSHYHRE